MQINLIVARSINKVIGFNNKLPWHLPVDLAHFKNTTLGKPIIMGRKTFESIGKPLPNRTNIVLTQNLHQITGVEIANSKQQALQIAKKFPCDEIFIIGGAEIFEMFLPYVDKIYLTEVQTIAQGDCFFDFDIENWQLINQSFSEIDANNQFSCKFMQFIRKK